MHDAPGTCPRYRLTLVIALCCATSAGSSVADLVPLPRVFPSTDFTITPAATISQPILEMHAAAAPTKKFAVPFLVGPAGEITGNLQCKFLGRARLVLRDGAAPPQADPILDHVFSCASWFDRPSETEPVAPMTFSEMPLLPAAEGDAVVIVGEVESYVGFQSNTSNRVERTFDVSNGNVTSEITRNVGGVAPKKWTPQRST